MTHRPPCSLRRGGALLLASLLLAPAASAQLDDELGDGDDLSFEAPEPAPRPAPAPVAAPPPAPPPPAAPAESWLLRDHRPQDPWVFGLGAGWSFPADLLVPNTASARLAFPGVVTLEPFVQLSLAHQNTFSRLDSPFLEEPNEDETNNLALRAGVGTVVRVPVFSRGNLDLQLLGNASVNHTTSFQDLGEDTQGTSHTTSAIVGWGVGIEWFFLPRLALSVDARNPIVSWSRVQNDTRSEVSVPDPETGELQTEIVEQTASDSTLTAGAIFAPTVVLMLHFYF